MPDVGIRLSLLKNTRHTHETEERPWLPRYRVKIFDENCIEASERRFKVLHEVQGRVLPGKSLRSKSGHTTLAQ
jgi:hypothetical protein